MAEILNTAARQFEIAGDKDIASGIAAWAEVARKRARLSLPTVEGETPPTKSFDEATTRILKSLGYHLFDLTGSSINDLRNSGIRTPYFKPNYKFASIPSRRSQVAINFDKFLLEGSNDKSFGQQLEMLAEFNMHLKSRARGAEAVMGSASDIGEIIISCGSQISLPKGAFIRTDTTKRYIGDHFSGVENVTIGRPVVGQGLIILGKDIHRGVLNLWMAPVIVPAA